MKEPTDQRTKLLETLLRQVLQDAIAQGVLMEWWGVISHALDIANESESYGEGGGGIAGVVYNWQDAEKILCEGA